MAVRVVQQEKYIFESYVLRGGRPEGGIYSLSQADESSLYVPQGTYGQDTLRPVTIKQVLDAQQPHPDADFKIDEVEITQVTDVWLTCWSILGADTEGEDYVCGPNPEYLDADYEYYVQA